MWNSSEDLIPVFFGQWRCFWHLPQPRQSLRSSHSEQLLGLSLGLLGGTHYRRPDSCGTGSVGATQHLHITRSKIPMFLYLFYIVTVTQQLKQKKTCSLFFLFADSCLETERSESFWNKILCAWTLVGKITRWFYHLQLQASPLRCACMIMLSLLSSKIKLFHIIKILILVFGHVKCASWLWSTSDRGSWL